MGFLLACIDEQGYEVADGEISMGFEDFKNGKGTDANAVYVLPAAATNQQSIWSRFDGAQDRRQGYPRQHMRRICGREEHIQGCHQNVRCSIDTC